jgi:uncharacterized protein
MGRGQSSAQSRQAWRLVPDCGGVFANEIVERIDDREDYGEVRFIALGRVDMAIFRVVYTWRGEGVIRIISAQKAGKNEREIYYRQIFP